jgi:hypothetical protein
MQTLAVEEEDHARKQVQMHKTLQIRWLNIDTEFGKTFSYDNIYLGEMKPTTMKST